MNTDRFSGKSILITGGAGGLGSQIARSVIAQGGSVGILDTNDDAIKSLVSELKASGGNAAGHKVDVRDVSSIDPASRIAFEKVIVTVPALKKFEEMLG